MKKIDSFEYRVGWESVKSVVHEVNSRIVELHNTGVENIDVNVTSSGKGVVYTLIYDV